MVRNKNGGAENNKKYIDSIENSGLSNGTKREILNQIYDIKKFGNKDKKNKSQKIYLISSKFHEIDPSLAAGDGGRVKLVQTRFYF
jgi:hypothetical protein